VAVVAGPCGEALSGLIWKLETGKPACRSLGAGRSKLETGNSKLENRRPTIDNRQSTIENRLGVLRRAFSFPVFLGTALAVGTFVTTSWDGVPAGKVFKSGDTWWQIAVGKYILTTRRINDLAPDTPLLLRKYGVNACLIIRTSALDTYLAASPDWERVYPGRICTIFERKPNATPKGPKDSRGS